MTHIMRTSAYTMMIPGFMCPRRLRTATLQKQQSSAETWKCGCAGSNVGKAGCSIE